MNPDKSSRLGQFTTRHALSIAFIAIVLCLAGIFCARNTPSSVFPRTDFPRIVVMVNNGIMPANEMMATITRPIEEAMKSIPGVVSVRSSTSRGSAIINVLFNWGTDMERADVYVLGQLSEIRSDLGHRVHRCFPRRVFAQLSHHRHQPYQLQRKPDGPLECRQLHH